MLYTSDNLPLLTQLQHPGTIQLSVAFRSCKMVLTWQCAFTHLQEEEKSPNSSLFLNILENIPFPSSCHGQYTEKENQKSSKPVLGFVVPSLNGFCDLRPCPVDIFGKGVKSQSSRALSSALP